MAAACSLERPVLPSVAPATSCVSRARRARRPYHARHHTSPRSPLQCLSSRQHGPGAIALQPKKPLPRATLVSKVKRALGDAAASRASPSTRKLCGPAWSRVSERKLPRSVLPFHGLDVPGEGDHVAPEAFAVIEHGKHSRYVAACERSLELSQPGDGALIGVGVTHEVRFDQERAGRPSRLRASRRSQFSRPARE